MMFVRIGLLVGDHAELGAQRVGVEALEPRGVGRAVVGRGGGELGVGRDGADVLVVRPEVDARVRRPIADVIDSTAATLTLRPDADPDVVEALFHAAKAEARARAARMGGSGSDDAPLGVVGSSPATTKLALATIRRGAAVGARLAAIRFAEATFAAPVDLTIDRSDPAKTPANPSTLAVDGFASGALLPASFFALAKNLAALAGEAEDPAFLEPIANALWTASDSARRVGAESALASALVAALSGAADGDWFGVAFDTHFMANSPYAIVVDGAGAVTEHVLANHAAGSR